MAVRFAATWRVRPGRSEDFLKLAKDWRPIAKRFKMKNEQLLQVAAGNAELPFNTAIYTCEFEKGVDYGAWLDSGNEDAGMQEWQARAFADDAPAELVSTGILTEVPGF